MGTDRAAERVCVRVEHGVLSVTARRAKEPSSGTHVRERGAWNVECGGPARERIEQQNMCVGYCVWRHGARELSSGSSRALDVESGGTARED